MNRRIAKNKAMVIIGTKVGIIGQDRLAAILAAIVHLKSHDRFASRVFIIGSYSILESSRITRRLSKLIAIQKKMCMVLRNLMNMDNAVSTTISLHFFPEIIFLSFNTEEESFS